MQLFYTARSGESLSEIAIRWQIPLDSLVAANNLADPNVIYVGQQLSLPPGVDIIRVQTGDTVFRIAQRFGVPMQLIIETNQLGPPFIIEAGQLLRVPPGVPYYVVQPGDTLYSIASRFNVTTNGRGNPELIRIVNNLPSSLIIPGMRLVIPYAPPGGEGQIAYTANDGEGYDIWLYDVRSGRVYKLTNGLGESYSVPFWSPDGRKIAFVGRDRIIFVVEVDDGRVARIDQLDEEQNVFLDWSPDSRKLAYVNQSDVVLYDVTTHTVKRFQQPGARDVQWFPNGLSLLFQASDEAGISQLYILSTGGEREQLTQNTGSAYNYVRLSPDGSHVLYTTPGVSISIIFTIDLSTGDETEIPGGPLAKNYFPEWSPDSSTIVYSATSNEEVGYFSQVRTTGRQGENDRVRAISDCFATPVTWSSAGTHIAYLSGCDGEGEAGEMWMLDIRHPVPIQLVKDVQITALQWSPRKRRTYRSTIFNVQLEYPANWQFVGNDRYEGPEGFFQVSAISSESTLEEVCQGEAFHQLAPYGSAPRIISTSLQGQPACMIFPSEDQPADMRNQAALIVRYPVPIIINRTPYQYFILWADMENINEMTETLVFLSE